MIKPQKTIKTVNPAYLYTILWLGILYLFSLRLSYSLIDLNEKFLVYIVLSSLLFSLPAVVSSFNRHKVYQIIHILELKNVKPLFCFWFLCVFIEIGFWGIFPFFGLLGLNARRYTDWGFSGFHGLLNAILMAYGIINWGNYLISKDKKCLHISLLCYFWPLFLFTRQMFMSLFIQYFFVYYYLSKFKIKSFLKILSIFFLVVFLFGYFGDMRSPLFRDNARPTEKYPEFLPSGFLWVYMYVTTPMNNIIYNIDKYPLLNFSFFDAFQGLLPSNIRRLLKSSQDLDFELVSKTFNVSSAHWNFLAGFGVIGSLFYQIFISIIITLFYIKYKFTNNSKYCFIISILAHNVILSFFVDTFTNLVFLFEIVFVYIFSKKIKIK
jgi:oligosaccharide repeat unit polymerase